MGTARFDTLKSLMIDKDIKIVDIAETLGRSVGSIDCKIKNIIYNYYKEGKDIEFIMENCPYDSKEYIQDIIEVKKSIENNGKYKKKSVKYSKTKKKHTIDDVMNNIEEVKLEIKSIKLMLVGFQKRFWKI